MSNATIPLDETFRFCPRCGREAASVGGSPFRCAACEHMHFFNPKSAVAGIVADPQGQVMMLRRALEPGKGMLGLPGGFVDPGETLEEALAREVLEETALVATATNYLASFPNEYLYRGVSTSVMDVFYTCVIESFDPLRASPDEVQSIEFVHPTADHLTQMAFESNRKALALYLQRQHV